MHKDKREKQEKENRQTGAVQVRQELLFRNKLLSTVLESGLSTGPSSYPHIRVWISDLDSYIKMTVCSHTRR